MTFFDYLDRHFSNLTVEIKDNYNNWKKGQLNACHYLIDCQRSWVKWITIPGLVIGFWLTKLGLKQLPEDKMFKLKEEMKAKYAEEQKKQQERLLVVPPAQ